jgi:catechol 1,2-dioxygenase
VDRRNFLSSLGLTAVAIYTSGYIRYNGVSFVGDCETTSDLLGPFYRPMSPVRNNLIIEDSPLSIVKLNGVIRHDDCITPYKGAKIEIWHADQNGKYDNTSKDFRYRGTTYCDENGAYEITTQIPIPYPDSEGNYRPAHFHFLISAGGYQSLITQIYLSGDPYLTKDAASASKKATNRILPITEKNGQKEIEFNIVMARKLKISVAGLEKIVGNYKGINHDKQMDFFAKDGQLWANWNKTAPYGEPYEYKGNNHFEYEGWPESGHYTLDFIFQQDGKIKLKENYYWNSEDNSILEYIKEK